MLVGSVRNSGYSLPMPSPAHETLILHLAQHPELLSELVQRILGGPAGEPLRVVDSALRLANPIEVRPDLVLEGASSWVIFEAQGSTDEAKGRRWAVAAAVLVDQRRVMGDVLVMTHSPAIAEWSLQVAVLRGPWGTELALKPRVILVDEQAAELLLDPSAPHLAFFAAWAMQDRHGPDAIRIVDRAVAISGELPAPLQKAQVQAILNVLSPVMLETWRQRMESIASAPESPAFKLFREQIEARAEARAEAKILLRLLQQRGFVVSPEQSQRVLSCRDSVQIEAWVDRVLTAAKLEDVLG